MKKNKKFDEWVDAEEWAKEHDISLEPVGTFTGEERVIASQGDKEVWERIAEVAAVWENHTEIVHITEYIVVSPIIGTPKDIYHADDWQDAMDQLDRDSGGLRNFR